MSSSVPSVEFDGTYHFSGIKSSERLFTEGVVRAAAIGILAIVMAAGSAACGGSTTSATATSPSGTVVVTAGVARGTGTVQFMNLEGGFFALRGDDGVTYDPINLPAAFQRHALRVRFEARIRQDLGGFHMVGPIVDVITIAAD
jgi:hypothetical protein